MIRAGCGFSLPAQAKGRPVTKVGRGATRSQRTPMAWLNSGRWQPGTVEKTAKIVAAVKKAYHLDAIGAFAVKNECSGKARNAPSPNAVIRRVPESKNNAHRRCPGEMHECLLGLVNKTKSCPNSRFGQGTGREPFNILGGKGGLLNTLKHCRRERMTAAAWLAACSRMPV